MRKLVVKNRAPLHIAAWKGHLAIFTALLDKVVSLNMRDYEFKTLLELARANGQTEIVDYIQKTYQTNH